MFALKSPCFNLVAKAASNFCGKGIKCSKSFSQSVSLHSKWHVMSAAIVERCPVITQKMTKIERDFSDLMWTIEKEQSSLSDHGLRHVEDKKNAARKLKIADHQESEDGTVVLTAQDMEDKWQEEFEQIKFGSRTTEADEKNDQKSLERKLDRKLVLLVEQKLGDKNRWVVPMSLRKDKESMREAAERTLLESCGPELKVHFLGNAPWSFYQYEYPEGSYKDYIGAKVFFFKAHYLSGSLGPQSPDYKWLTKQEIHQFATPKYASHVKDSIQE